MNRFKSFIESKEVCTQMKQLEPQLVAAITIAVLKHRATLHAQSASQTYIHSAHAQREAHADRWVSAGRARQNQPWHPPKKS